MSEEQQKPKTDLARQMAPLRALDGGAVENIDCPECQQPSVSVWFSNPQPDEYRTWFICNNCTYKMRAQNSGRPSQYSEARRKPGLEGYDADLIRKAKFPRPF
jgi:hypothetical protein